MPDQPFSPDSFQTFGDLLKYLRRRERLTQLELSIMVGYSEAQMTRLEKYQRRPEQCKSRYVKDLCRPNPRTRYGYHRETRIRMGG